MTTAQTREVSSQDILDFFGAFGIRKPIDLRTSKDTGLALRETVSQLAPRLVKQGLGDGFIDLQDLRDKPIRPEVFAEIASFDQDPSLSTYELALTLEVVGLLKLPQGHNVSSLWLSSGSTRWHALKEMSDAEVIKYLERHPNDDRARHKALEILEALRQRLPAYFESALTSERLMELMLVTEDVSIRRRFLNLFQIPAAIEGDNLRRGVGILREDFEPLLAKLNRIDLPTIREMLQSSNPKKVAFGLLCAERILRGEELREIRRWLASQSPLLTRGISQYQGAPVTLKDFMVTIQQLSRRPLPTLSANIFQF